MEKIIFKNEKEFPYLLTQISDPPKKIYVKGNLPNLDAKILCVVGARAYSNYGKEVTEKLISGLRGYNICIISGLALGIDSIAHRSAIEAGLHTVSFPGSGLDPSVIYPATHARLAEEILKSGGGLISEFKPTQKGTHWTFPVRNRLMAGISHATLVIEAELLSGTLITSKFAGDYNRDVGAVPGQIFSPLSAGPHMLIRNGAIPITSSDDILEMLGFARREGQSKLPLDTPGFQRLSLIEKKILHLIQNEPRTKDALIRELTIDTRTANTFISSLEIEGFIKEDNGIIKLS